MAPALNAGGYSSEALSFALALEKEPQRTPPHSRVYNSGDEYSTAAPGRFGIRQFAEQDLIGAGRKKEWDVVVCHATPDVWHADGGVGPSLHMSDGPAVAFVLIDAGRCDLPALVADLPCTRAVQERDQELAAHSWGYWPCGGKPMACGPAQVPRINAMDEVWVPSAWALEQFASSGIDKDKIVVMPEAVDTELFDPSRHSPLEQGDDGWDLLLRAYFEEFSAEDPVVLRVKTQAFHTDGDFEAKVQSFVATLDAARRPLARHTLISEDLPLRDMPRLYRGADAVVLPTRGEGWGRPHVEAMAMALPVIATNWSGPTAFLSDAYSLPLRIDGLVDVEEGQGPAGHRWAQPSVAHLRGLMRWAAEHRAEAAALGARAREAMRERFSPGAVARGHLLPRLRRLRGLLAEEGRSEL
ncbi:unnamed protein product [Prorocentrum cordatum]|uniref:Glycosyl transferase family 1 domain-containing protein n=1 Tax=Prorocentrum cordatum TaxID=2364126 RepID=A0ABN9TEG9_9DINO|nr:unnamed protein product [Polarella glacialis]